MFNKNTFIVGFMLFAMFFGAGNLIFPPKLGLQSGSEFIFAISGFILTGVGLPLLAVIISAYYTNGYQEALNRINPLFSTLFLMAIYLSLGPFFAIPRTAATAYEMAILPSLDAPTDLIRLAFSLVYFALALWLALSPSKMVSRIGAVLTPILLCAILALVLRAFFLFEDKTLHITTMPEEGSAFFKGFLEGYFTMDALAAIIFSVIVIAAIKAKGIAGEHLTKQVILSGLVAAIALSLVYVSLAWIGNKVTLSPEVLASLSENKQDIGTFILNSVAHQAFGKAGQVVLAVIVSLACLTTAVGLIVSVSQYFHQLYPRLAYKHYALVFTLIGLVIANQGLNEVIKGSVPVLLILYPIVITVILVLLTHLFVKVPLMAQRLSVGLVTIVSILSVLNLEFMQALPLKAYSMEWLPFALVGLGLGWLRKDN
ncbi:branched-chain amino acid transport system II carrier protein [Pasteurellaceae bacterium RH1A]|nr:branched-chain amino acid transport system II carrier protein [Pasteurellaceae bacterium RH1A]